MYKMARVFLIPIDYKRNTIEINSNRFSLGRAASNSYVIDEKGLSEIHCVFKNVNDVWNISDKSVNGGITVNKKRLGIYKSCVVQPNDIIALTNTLRYIFRTKPSANTVDFEANSIMELRTGKIKKQSTEIKEIADSVGAVKRKNTYSSLKEHFEQKEKLNNSIHADIAVKENSIKLNLENILTEFCLLKIKVCSMLSAQKLAKDIEKVINDMEVVLAKKNGTEPNPADGALVENKDVVMWIMEEEFQCSICSELFIEATTLNCSHTFCKRCIFQWKRKQNICPVCRLPIVATTQCVALDNYIDHTVSIMSPAKSEIRNQLKQTFEENARMNYAGNTRTPPTEFYDTVFNYNSFAVTTHNF